MAGPECAKIGFWRNFAFTHAPRSSVAATPQKRLNKYLKHFIQVNIGDEDKKSGIHINAAEKFYDTCKNELELDIVGLMCIPPVDQDSEKYFSEMQKLKIKLKLKELSMGMSSDYLKAIKFSSSFVRIGSKIFGERT